MLVNNFLHSVKDITYYVGLPIGTQIVQNLCTLSSTNKINNYCINTSTINYNFLFVYIKISGLFL